jgi:hypothetical protein
MKAYNMIYGKNSMIKHNDYDYGSDLQDQASLEPYFRDAIFTAVHIARGGVHEKMEFCGAD